MMTSKALAVLISLLCLVLPVVTGTAADKSPENADQAKPKIFFPETQFEFSSVLEGTNIVHDFKVQNKGNAVLKIERVKTG